MIAGHETVKVYYVTKTYCDCFETFDILNSFAIYVAVTEGTKVEDVWIDLECPHNKQLFVSKYLELVVLTYPLLEFLVAFVEHKNVLDEQLALR